MLLAIDTSTAQVGLALYNGIQVLAEYAWRSDVHHTQELAPALSQMLRRAQVRMEQVAAVGVALGPGSFTSLRVGLAFAKGLVAARHMAVIGIPTLDIVAAAIPVAGERLIAIVQAGRGRLAAGWYHPGSNGWVAEGPASVTTADELAEQIHKPVFICGELDAEDRSRLARKFRNVTLASPALCVRRPAILAEVAWMRWQSGRVDSAEALAPIYLHVAGGIPA